MGQQVDISLPSLFGGVSRQPDIVRRENQVEEATNALSSVVTGGFEKRPGTQHIAELSGLDTSVDYAVFFRDRDPTTQHAILIDPDNATVHVFDAIDGSSETVTYSDVDHYLEIEHADIDSTGEITSNADGAQMPPSSAETETVWNYQLSDTNTVFKLEGSADGTTWNDIATAKTGASGSFTTTHDAVATGDHNYVRVNITTAAGSSADTITVYGTAQTTGYLLADGPEDISLLSVADFILIGNREKISATTEQKSGTVDGQVQTFSDLPASPSDGDLYQVVGDNTDGFGSYYVVFTSSTGVWTETVDPVGYNELNANSLPHRLVVNTDGSFTFGTAAYTDRIAGDDETAPLPTFIGSAIKDMAFFGTRLAFTAGEGLQMGVQGDILNFWPQAAVRQVATDPIDRTSSTNQVTLLQWLSVFRKTLFATAVNAQFELTGANSQLTPDTASFDKATSYAASLIARPVSVGDLLYFAATAPNKSIVYEYYFEETSLSNTAIDVTRHIGEYIPSEITQMDADPASNTIFVRSSAQPWSIFVYRTFYDGDNKIQSAWGRYDFGSSSSDAYIHGFAVLSGFLVMVIERPGGIMLEQMPIEREAIDADLGYAVLLDQRTVLTGSYNSGTDLTTWTTPYDHDDDAVVVLSGDFDDPGDAPVVSYPSATTVTATGDFSGGQAYVGRPYTMTVQFSKPFVRPSKNEAAITPGNLTLNDIVVTHQTSGYYRVRVTPLARDAVETEFTARIIGSIENLVGTTSIEEVGKFRAPIAGNAETTKVEIINDTFVPCIITSASFRGFFTERTRQG